MRKVQIIFNVQGYVKQIVEVDDDLSNEALEKKLNNGKILTTIQEDGSIDRLSGKTVGKVLSVDNECEYSDFKVI